MPISELHKISSIGSTEETLKYSYQEIYSPKNHVALGLTLQGAAWGIVNSIKTFKLESALRFLAGAEPGVFHRSGALPRLSRINVIDMSWQKKVA